MDHLKKELLHLIAPLSGTVSLYIKFLDANAEIKHNETIQLKAASIIKLPILCEFYNQVKNNTIDTEKWIKLSGENIVDGSGVLKLLHRETEYTIEDLARFMIILSDNSATNQIVDIIGWEKVESYMKTLSLHDITFRHKMMIAAGRGENLITAENIGTLLEKIYRNEIAGSNEMLTILKQQQMNQYLPKLLPKTIEIAHKTGSADNSLHDVGIVFAKNPFLIVFLSEEQQSREETGMVLRQCAKHCFDYSN